MARKHKLVYLDTKLQALDEVDKDWKLRLELLKSMVFCVAYCQHGGRTNKDALRKAHRNLCAN